MPYIQPSKNFNLFWRFVNPAIASDGREIDMERNEPSKLKTSKRKPYGARSTSRVFRICRQVISDSPQSWKIDALSSTLVPLCTDDMPFLLIGPRHKSGRIEKSVYNFSCIALEPTSGSCRRASALKRNLSNWAFKDCALSLLRRVSARLFVSCTEVLRSHLFRARWSRCSSI